MEGNAASAGGPGDTGAQMGYDSCEYWVYMYDVIVALPSVAISSGLIEKLGIGSGNETCTRTCTVLVVVSIIYPPC